MAHLGKVLFLATAVRSVGGIQRFNRTFLRACSVLGVVCEVHSLSDSPDAGADAGGSHTLHGYSGNRLRFVLRTLMTLVLGSYDSVIVGHVNFARFAMFAVRLFGSRGTRVLMVAHGIEVWGITHPSRGRAIAKLDQVLCVSRYTRDRLCSNVPALDPRRCVIFPNALDEASMSGALTDQCSGPPSIPANRFILSVSRLDPRERYKGIVTVLEALAMLEDQSVHYVVAGGGADTEFLQRVARRFCVDHRVHFLGVVSDSDLVALYGRCDLFVLPSGREGFGIVFLEAMYHGAVVVAAGAKGALDVIETEHSGVLVPFGDTVGLRVAIDRLLVDKGLRVNIRRRAHATVSGDGPFSFPAFVARCGTALQVGACGGPVRACRTGA